MSRMGKKSYGLNMLAIAASLLAGCGKEKESGEAPGGTIVVFDYLYASKVQTIELFGEERTLFVADSVFSAVSDSASGVEYETSYTKGFLFNDLPFESFKTVRVAGPDQSVELDVSSLDWQNLGAGRTNEGFQYDALYITVLDSKSKPLFP